MKRQIVISMVLATVLLFGIVPSAPAELPNPGMVIVADRTALVVTDPQNDFLSPKGVTWGVVGKSVTENNTVENIEKLFKAAKANEMPVFISPHYYGPCAFYISPRRPYETITVHTVSLLLRSAIKVSL